MKHLREAELKKSNKAIHLFVHLSRTKTKLGAVCCLIQFSTTVRLCYYVAPSRRLIKDDLELKLLRPNITVTSEMFLSQRSPNSVLDV